MRGNSALRLVFIVLALVFRLARADDPYRFLTRTITYGTIYPLGVPQQGILINGMFPGPRLVCMTNDNIILNVVNKLDQPFLLTWNGIKQRKNSWQDGVLGTNCPIPPGGNYTYRWQPKDQIGTYSYFPSTGLHKAAGGYGGIVVVKRPFIPVPYAQPAGDHTVLIGDWYKYGHKTLQHFLVGIPLPFPDGVVINGQAKSSTFNVDQGKTFIFRISNVGLQSTLNFRIQGHKLKLVEIEGTHPIENVYDSLDVHVGQSMAVLVTADQPAKDYYIVASTRFTGRVLTATGVLHYSNSRVGVSGTIPWGPTYELDWSLNQARSFRWNLSASAARPNPQGSFHYGQIVPSKTIVLVNSAPRINGKLRYSINEVSYVNPDTPLKIADWFNIVGVFSLNSIQAYPSGGAAYLGTAVMPIDYHAFVEIVFQNNENSLQSWHLDGYDFWVVGMGWGQWSGASRKTYNLVDAPTRYTVQVYPNAWTAIYVSIDSEGMWNLRSAMWARQYLGQQLYLRVWTSEFRQELLQRVQHPNECTSLWESHRIPHSNTKKPLLICLIDFL